MHRFNLNGKICRGGERVIPADARGLRYGDGLFETMLLQNSEIRFADAHFARLWKGMQLLRMTIPKLWSPELFSAQIQQLAVKNNLVGARVRLMVFRGTGGIFENISTAPQYIIETTALAASAGKLNENGLQLCIYADARKSMDAFSNIKHNNCLPYMMAAAFAKEQQCNEALVLNSAGNVCESTIANFFMVKDDTVITPPLSEGCVGGVMRKYLIETMRAAGVNVAEKPISIDDAMAADEIFLSNAISGIRWVVALGDKTYKSVFLQENILPLTREAFNP